MIVAIHQPNFIPWLGYFNKIARADVFVLLDHVQFPKKGGTWVNRVKIRFRHGPDWLTIPVDRAYHGTRAIHDIAIRDDQPWRRQMLQTLQTSYGRAPAFDDIFPAAREWLALENLSLASFNHRIISDIAARLNLRRARMVTSSSLNVSGAATDLLISVIKAVNGTAYLCGGGSNDYLEPAKFAAAGIDLVFQNFQHPTYPQAGADDFAPGLSMLDALFNLGFDRAGQLVRA